eukprot:403360135
MSTTIQNCKERLQNKLAPFKELIHPHSNAKFYWDMIIIILSLVNAIYVPVEITFNIETPPMEAINYIMDCVFVADIIVNFRTIQLDERTSDAIIDPKQISLNYIFKGRFFVDLISTIPLEFIGDIENVNVSKSTLKLIGLIKLTRLLRLARIITYIKMNKNLKDGIRVIMLAVYLFLIIHWIDCAAYYVFQVGSEWLPPKDVIPNSTNIYDDLKDGYFVMFYYSSLFLMSNDALPYTTVEVFCCIIFVFMGSVSLGLLIGQFASIINQITKKARVESEKIEFLQQMMFTLKIPEVLQLRIIEYYESTKKSQYIVGPQRLKMLAPSLVQKISDHQLQALIQTIPLLKHSDNHLSSMFSKFTTIQIYLPGDLVLKQGDEGSSFFFIINGYANVIREQKDMNVSKFHQLANDNLAYNKQTTLFHKIGNFFKKNNKQSVKDTLNQIQRISTMQEPKSRKQTQRRANVFVPKEISNEEKQFQILRELDEGKFFGEISLLTNLKVTSTVYAMHYLTCGQIIERKFLQIIKNSAELKNRLLHKIKKYKDPIFQEFNVILKNAFIFKHLNKATLQKISYLFKQERRMKGQVLIRKRERTDQIFFVKSGEVEVRFPFSVYDAQTTQTNFQPNQDSFENPAYADVSQHESKKLEDEVIYFAKINEGGYFNLSSALLKKFSLFEFVVSSKKCDLLILNASDLVAQSKKCEDLYFALESHAVLYEVDGQKYDFNRCTTRFNPKHERDDTQEINLRNKINLMNAIKAIKPKQFLNLRILALVDELFNLRRDKFIRQKRRQYLKELKEKRIQNENWYKHFLVMKDQANKYNQEFTEETEEQLMKVVDTIKDEQKLLQSFSKQFYKMQGELERKADRYIQLKCYKAGMNYDEFVRNIEMENHMPKKISFNVLQKQNTLEQQDDSEIKNVVPDPEEILEEQQLRLIKLNQGEVLLESPIDSDIDSVETQFDDLRFIIERHKRELQLNQRFNRIKSIKREQLLQLENVKIKELVMARSIVNLNNVKVNFKEKVKRSLAAGSTTGLSKSSTQRQMNNFQGSASRQMTQGSRQLTQGSRQQTLESKNNSTTRQNSKFKPQ